MDPRAITSMFVVGVGIVIGLVLFFYRRSLGGESFPELKDPQPWKETRVVLEPAAVQKEKPVATKKKAKKKTTKKKVVRKKARSAKSGRYVDRDYAKKNPDTTVLEKD